MGGRGLILQNGRSCSITDPASLPPKTKSLALHLYRAGRLEAPRRLRLPQRFADDVAALVCALSTEVAARCHQVRLFRAPPICMSGVSVLCLLLILSPQLSVSPLGLSVLGYGSGLGLHVCLSAHPCLH